MTDLNDLPLDNLPSLPELFARADAIAAHSEQIARQGRQRIRGTQQQINQMAEQALAQYPLL